MDPLTISTLISVGTSLFGSFFGGSDDEDKEYLNRVRELKAQTARLQGEQRDALAQTRAIGLERDIAEVNVSQVRTRVAQEEVARGRELGRLLSYNSARGDANSASFRAMQREALRDADEDLRVIRHEGAISEKLAKIRMHGLQIERSAQFERLASLVQKEGEAIEAMDDTESQHGLSTLFEVGGHLFDGYQNGAFESFGIGNWFKKKETSAVVGDMLNAMWT